MRNIINLLYRYNAVLLFIVLEVAAFALLLTYNSYHRASYFNSSSSVMGWFKDATHTLKEPFTAMEENEQLRKENRQLRDQLPQNFYRINPETVTIDDTLYHQQFTYVEAQVIDDSYNRPQNYITLNVGKDQGVKKDMGVVGPHGIVGFVKDAGSKYSHVISVLHSKFSTAVKIKKTNHSGILSWNGQDPGVAQIQYLINTAPIEKGDTIVTKGASGRFPEGIMVGTVKSVKVVQGNSHYDLHVKLATDFTNLYHTYVVVNHFKKELDEMRALQDEDDE